jgi:hypothetical protein
MVVCGVLAVLFERDAVDRADGAKFFAHGRL